MEKQFTSADVVKLAHITDRQLQWWIEQRLVFSRLEGHARRFSTENALRVMLIAELKRRGVSLEKIRHMSVSLDRNMAGALNSPSQTLLLASDRRTLQLIDTGTPLDSLRGFPRGIFLIPISEFIQKIERHKLGIRRAPYAENGETFRKKTAGERRWKRVRESGDWMRGVGA